MIRARARVDLSPLRRLRSARYDAEKAKAVTIWSQYTAAGKPPPQSVEVTMIDPKTPRGPRHVIPSVVPDAADPTKGRVVGAPRLGR